MILIKINQANKDILFAVNDGVVPEVESDKFGMFPTFLVVDSGEINRIVTFDEMLMLRQDDLLYAKDFKIYYYK